MKPLFTIRYLLILTALASLGGVYIATRGTAASLETDYPDAPFAKISAGVACLIEHRAAPSGDDKAATAAYQEERRGVYSRMSSEGASTILSEAERKLVALSDKNKFVQVRKMAEEILREKPLSIPAMFVRALALSHGESNPAAALHQLQVLRRYLHKLGCENPKDLPSRDWYLQTVNLEYETLKQLGREEEALRCVELLEQVFRPLPWRRITPLIRLKRFDEAAAMIAATEKDGNWPAHCATYRVQLALQQGNREEAFKAFKSIPKPKRDLGDITSIALALFRFADAEAYFEDTVAIEGPRTLSTKYTDLANLSIQDGRLVEAADRLQKGREQRSKRISATWQFDQAAVNETLANLYLVSGHPADAERLARQINAFPDRVGYSFLTHREQATRSLLVLAEIIRCRLAEEQEQSPLKGTFITQKALQAELWTLEQKIAKSLTVDSAQRLLRPHLTGGLTTWQAAGLLDALPPGVAATFFSQAKQTETLTTATTYFDAFEVELRCRQGADEAALELAADVLPRLAGKGEKLLHLRTQSLAAKSAWNLGKIDDCLKYLDPVLESFPMALRLVDAALPVKIEHDQSDAALRLAGLFAASSRLHIHDAGLKLSIQHRDGKLHCELFRLSGARRFEFAVPIENDDVPAAVEQAYRQFHELLMTPLVTVDQIKLNSLNGAMGVSRDSAAISNMLDQAAKKK